ncbi:hypothetical protein A6E10_18410 [Aliivibrio fischeri]|nr:hypothetical protein A6E10_18410 [Aliivibrio fischeri]
MLTIFGLVLNLVGTILIALFGQSVSHYYSNGSENLAVNSGEEKALYKFTENAFTAFIGWSLLCLGFILHILVEILKLV